MLRTNVEREGGPRVSVVRDRLNIKSRGSGRCLHHTPRKPLCSSETGTESQTTRFFRPLISVCHPRRSFLLCILIRSHNGHIFLVTLTFSAHPQNFVSGAISIKSGTDCEHCAHPIMIPIIFGRHSDCDVARATASEKLAEDSSACSVTKTRTHTRSYTANARVM